MPVLIVICAVLLIGAFVFLIRSSPSQGKEGPAIGDADALVLQNAVREKLEARLAGWSIEQGPDGPLEIIVVEAATERRIILQLGQLAQGWLPLRGSSAEEADLLVEDFVNAVTGQSEAEQAEGDDWVQAALSVRLYKPDAAPKAAITRPAGPLVAALVMRNLTGNPETIARDELQAWGVSEDQAFHIALENLTGEAEDSLMLEPVGDDALQIAPGDPLATSYALVPALGPLLKGKFEGKEPRLFLGERGLVAIAGEGEPEGIGGLLIAGAQPLDVIAWKR